MSKKHSPEYIAMEAEEKKLLKNNRFDEAIALQKLRKKKEEEDNARYRLLHKAEIETLKKNLTNKYNKEVNNFKKNKQFNNRRHDLINIQNNKKLITNNVPLAKSRQFKKHNTNLSKSTIQRIMGPLNVSTLNEKKESNTKKKSMGKRLKSAKVDQ